LPVSSGHPQERLRPVLGDGLLPRSHVSEPSAASASPAMRSSSARSRPGAATTTFPLIGQVWANHHVMFDTWRPIPGEIASAKPRRHGRDQA
jgi:hypothetical protein